MAMDTALVFISMQEKGCTRKSNHSGVEEPPSMCVERRTIAPGLRLDCDMLCLTARVTAKTTVSRISAFKMPHTRIKRNRRGALPVETRQVGREPGPVPQRGPAHATGGHPAPYRRAVI